MRTGSIAVSREALLVTLAAALGKQTRLSAHPADLRALRRTAAELAVALEAEFHVIARHSSVTELIEPCQLSEAAHE